MRPAILAGFTLAFATSLAEFSIPRVIGQPAGIPLVTTTIYNFLLSYPQQIQSATVLSLVLVAVTLLVLWLQRRFLKVGARFVVVGGKSAASQRIDLGRARWPALAGIIAFVLATVVLPVIALLDVSFRRFWDSGLGFDQLTPRNYVDVAHTGVLTESIRNSVLFAAVGATAGMVLASLVAYIVVRTRATGRALVDQVAALPLAVPATVLGTGMLIVFLGPPVALYGTNLLLLLGYVAHYLPQGVRTVTAGFFQVDRGVEEAAYVAGSGWLGTFRRITLPLVAPVVLGGWIFLFVLMVREVSISVLVATPNTPVIGVQIVDLSQFGNAPRLAAFSTIVLVICIVPTALVTALGRRRRA
jgi:iron(III) transport system permease protein